MYALPSRRSKCPAHGIEGKPLVGEIAEIERKAPGQFREARKPEHAARPRASGRRSAPCRAPPARCPWRWTAHCRLSAPCQFRSKPSFPSLASSTRAKPSCFSVSPTSLLVIEPLKMAALGKPLARGVRPVARTLHRQLLQAQPALDLDEVGAHLAELPVAPGQLPRMEPDRGKAARIDCALAILAVRLIGGRARLGIGKLQPLEVQIPRRGRITGGGERYFARDVRIRRAPCANPRPPAQVRASRREKHSPI